MGMLSYLGDATRCEADDHGATTPVERADTGLEQLTSHHVHHHVDAGIARHLRGGDGGYGGLGGRVGRVQVPGGGYRGREWGVRGTGVGAYRGTGWVEEG